MPRKFTEEEINTIRDWYSKWDGKVYTIKGLAELLGRSSATVARLAGTLGLTNRNRPHPWRKPGQWLLAELKNLDEYRKRARSLYRLPELCERCRSSKPHDRHHIDGNPRNNTPSNIAFLCRRCHMSVDGRLERVSELLKSLPRPGPSRSCCIVCGIAKPPYRHGRCHRCNEFLRRHGYEWSFEAANPPKNGICRNCGQPNGRVINSLCHNCESYRQRTGKDRPKYLVVAK